MSLVTAVHGSRLGPVAITTADGALRALTLDPGAHGPVPDGVAAEAARQLDEYLAGTRRTFDLPLDPQGTDFEREVWQALTTIPYGQTRTYGEIAVQTGRESWSAARAVGRANGRNPLWVVVPCHRMIGADGTLTGYAGGLDVKRTLLDLERDVTSGAQRLWPAA